jgi:carboxypeptidase PM20D1
VDDPEVAVRALPKRREPTRASRIDGPGWEAVARTVREVFPGTVVAPYLMVAGTDSRHFRDLCDCVYQFVPFRVEVADMKRAHGTDERIPVAAVPDAVRFYRRLIGNVAGAPAERSP